MAKLAPARSSVDCGLARRATRLSSSFPFPSRARQVARAKVPDSPCAAASQRGGAPTHPGALLPRAAFPQHAPKPARAAASPGPAPRLAWHDPASRGPPARAPLCVAQRCGLSRHPARPACPAHPALVAAGSRTETACPAATRPTSWCVLPLQPKPQQPACAQGSTPSSPQRQLRPRRSISPRWSLTR
jgi:hypothetical protein